MRRCVCMRPCTRGACLHARACLHACECEQARVILCELVCGCARIVYSRVNIRACACGHACKFECECGSEDVYRSDSEAHRSVTCASGVYSLLAVANAAVKMQNDCNCDSNSRAHPFLPRTPRLPALITCARDLSGLGARLGGLGRSQQAGRFVGVPRYRVPILVAAALASVVCAIERACVLL